MEHQRCTEAQEDLPRLITTDTMADLLLLTTTTEVRRLLHTFIKCLLFLTKEVTTEALVGTTDLLLTGWEGVITGPNTESHMDTTWEALQCHTTASHHTQDSLVCQA